MQRANILILLACVAAGCSKRDSSPAESPPAPEKAAELVRSATPEPAPNPTLAPKEPDEFAPIRASQAAQGGPVNYKKFAVVLPDRLGPFRASSVLEGANEELAPGVVFSTGIRHYRAGQRLLIVTIADAFVNRVAPRLKGEKPAEGEPELGTTRSGKIGDYPALFGWIEDLRESKAFVLVGERVVEVRVVGAERAEDAEKAARLLKLDALRALRPEDK
jgi:hypothetical protein